jgi:hypothetical protein
MRSTSRRISPVPRGPITATRQPAACRAVASCQTRRSKGTGRFSTRITTRGRGPVARAAPLSSSDFNYIRGLAGRQSRTSTISHLMQLATRIPQKPCAAAYGFETSCESAPCGAAAQATRSRCELVGVGPWVAGAIVVLPSMVEHIVDHRLVDGVPQARAHGCSHHVKGDLRADGTD